MGFHKMENAAVVSKSVPLLISVSPYHQDWRWFKTNIPFTAYLLLQPDGLLLKIRVSKSDWDSHRLLAVAPLLTLSFLQQRQK